MTVLNLAIAISFIASQIAVVLCIKYMVEDKTNTIRELTKAILSKDVKEYAETLPEVSDYEEEIPDEFEDVGNVDEKLLIRALNEQV